MDRAIGQMRRAWACLVLVGALVTGLELGPVRAAYRSVTTHASADAAASLIAVFTVFLVFGRLRREGRVSEILLASGLSLLAISGLIFALITGLEGSHPEQVSWVGRLDATLGGLLLAMAAFAPRRRLRTDLNPAVAALGIVALAAGASAIVVAIEGGNLTLGVRVLGMAGNQSWPHIHVSTGVILRHAIDAVLFGAASIGWLRKAERRRDELYSSLALSSVLLTFAEINYCFLPARFTQWVFVGDAFRLLGYLVLLVGAMLEIRSYWLSATQAAILDERRRIARDLHDGLAQEIAYIQRNLPSLEAPDEKQAERLNRVQRAVERAQLESRKTFAALAASPDEPLDVILQRAVSEIASRFGAELELDLVPVGIDPEGAESLVRIACEAVANAARHSGSDRITLILDRNGRGLRLRVRDYGQGFDPSLASEGFGLTSMRERAQAIGGELQIESGPGRGTTVEFSQ